MQLLNAVGISRLQARDDAKKATQRVWHTQGFASSIALPVVAGDQAPAALGGSRIN